MVSTQSTKDFERAAKWFFETDPYWRNKVDTVWLWDDWPGKWGPDNGIDLVFKDKENQTWAVQAKHYAPEYSITKNEINSFIAEASRPGIDQRLLIATTDKIAPNASRLLGSIEPSVVRLLRSDLERASVEWPPSLKALSTGHRKDPPTPDPHQEEAVNDVVLGFSDADRGQLIMACGTGKTYATLWVKERLGATRTLVLVPSLGLLSQTLKEWTFAAKTPFEVLCVCSDDSVGQVSNDEVLSLISDIPYPVEQDPSAIGKFLRSSSEQVIFCTYQSSELIANAQADPLTPAFDLVIADEAHRCTGKSQATFTNVLNDGFIRSKKRLFTTATPRTYSQSVRTRAEDRGVELASMDDAEMFGEPFHTLGFGKAIEDDLLNDYQVLVVGVDKPMIADWISRRELVQAESDIETDARFLAAQIGLLKAIQDYDIHSMITFHSKVQAAKDFSDELLKANDWLNASNPDEIRLKTDYVSGKMNARERSTKIKALKNATANQRVLLANCRCLSEGVDVPSLDGIAFIDPRQSTVDITQCVGRAIRKVRDSTKKGAGTIVIPVFIEPGDDSDAVIEASNFKPVWDVINALKAHDEILLYELDQSRIGLGRRVKPGGGGGFKKIIFDLPRTVDESFQESLSTQLVVHTTASWMHWYGLLVGYKDKTGDWPKQSTIFEGFKLGSWVSNQRKRSKKDKLTLERKAQLDALGFVWEPDATQWEAALEALAAYKEKTGDWPKHDTIFEGFKLGSWVSNQRKRSKKDKLTLERKAQLDALGFVWEPDATQWEAALEALAAYKEKTGDWPKQSTIFEGFKLGSWTSDQRKLKDTLPPERKAQLDALGFVWDVLTAKWEAGFAALVAYEKENDDCLVNTRHTTAEGFKLGTWVNRQRTFKDTLTPERIAQLDALGFVWDVLTAKWEAGFKALAAYKEKTGDWPQQKTTFEGFKLGSWTSDQRKLKDTSPPERKAQLDALGFVWDVLTAKWEAGFAALVAYEKENDDCLVQTRHTTAEGFKLGAWVNRQRTFKDTLTPERIAQLDALGFVWDVLTAKWEAGFKALAAYKEKTGDWPQQKTTFEGFKLGTWVTTQRTNKDTLPPERRDRLDALGFVWAVRRSNG